MAVDFMLTPEQEALRQQAHEFAARVIRPRVAELDRQPDPHGLFPWDIYEAANRLGYNRTIVPKEYGGPGYGDIENAIIIEELSWADAGIGTTYFAHMYSVRDVLEQGSEAQKQRFLRELCTDPRERYLMAVCATEHGVAGPGTPRDYLAWRRTNPETPIPVPPNLAMNGAVGPARHAPIEVDPVLGRPDTTGGMFESVARLDGDDYVVNGQKRFITNAGTASLYVTWCRAEPAVDGFRFVKLLIPGDTPGLSLGHVEDKMGHRTAQNGEVNLDNVRVPRDALLPTFNLRGTNTGNIGCAALGAGLARAAYEEALAYAKVRQKGGNYILWHQSVGLMLADMAVAILTARLLTWRAAWNAEHISRDDPVGYLAKVYATDTAMKVTTDAVQIFGGYGYMRDFPAERYFRDAKLTQIYDGTNQMQRLGTLPWLATVGTI